MINLQTSQYPLITYKKSFAMKFINKVCVIEATSLEGICQRFHDYGLHNSVQKRRKPLFAVVEIAIF